MTPTPSTANPQQWVVKYADYLYAFALTRIGDEEHARDLVQETFLSALEGLGKFEHKSAERTWLTAILKKKIVDVYRKRAKQPITKSINVPEGESQFLSR